MRETLFYRPHGFEALYGLRRELNFKSTRVVMVTIGRRDCKRSSPAAQQR
jgi:hypothetical protein